MRYTSSIAPSNKAPPALSPTLPSQASDCFSSSAPTLLLFPLRGFRLQRSSLNRDCNRGGLKLVRGSTNLLLIRRPSAEICFDAKHALTSFRLDHNGNPNSTAACQCGSHQYPEQGRAYLYQKCAASSAARLGLLLHHRGVQQAYVSFSVSLPRHLLPASHCQFARTSPMLTPL